MHRVLIVEDSPTQAERLRSILESERFDVCVQPDGRRALEHLKDDVIDLVVSDIEMPRMTGFELCRKIKADPNLHATPVILLSYLNEPMDIISGLESGADNFLTKPYRPDQLVARIRTLLQNRRLREGARVLGVEIVFLGKRFTITSEKEQILDLLISTFEDTVQANKELQRSRSELAAANEELRRAKLAADAANRELEAFSYSAAHDLRAPLRSIEGFSRALVEDNAENLGEESRRHLQYVHDAARHMTQLVDDLLTLSQVTRSDFSHEPIDLTEMACAVMGRLQNDQPSRRVDVVIAEGLSAKGDARLVRIALENLLANAWKFTRNRDEARIEVGCATVDGERAFFVSDNGAGFDMAHAGKLFSAFQRLHSIHEFEGTGIGLAIVQRIIQRHGGRAWAWGSVGEGARFMFTLGGVRA